MNYLHSDKVIQREAPLLKTLREQVNKIRIHLRLSLKKNLYILVYKNELNENNNYCDKPCSLITAFSLDEKSNKIS